MLKVLASTMAAAALAYGSWVYHSGYFRTPTVEFKMYPALHMIFKEHNANRSEMVSARKEAKAFAKSNQIKCLATFEEFRDSVKDTRNGVRRVISGCVVPGDVGKLNSTEWKYEFIPSHELLAVTFVGSWRIGEAKMTNAAIVWRQANKKRMIRALRVHHEANPLWGQPVQEGLYTFVEVSADPANDKKPLRPPTNPAPAAPKPARK